MSHTECVIKSLEICDNLGNINIISEYIDDDELLIILSNRYWPNKKHVNTLIETYNIGYNLNLFFNLNIVHNVFHSL